MEELKVHIRHVMLWEFKNNKNATETAQNICKFIPKVSLLTTTSETGFQSFVLAICLRDMNPVQDIHQTTIKKNALKELMERNLHKSILELALDINSFQSTAT